MSSLIFDQIFITYLVLWQKLLFSSLAQSVKVMIAVAIFLTYSLQFYVPMEIIWKAVKHRFTKHPTQVEYGIRTVLVIMTGTLLYMICIHFIYFFSKSSYTEQ